MKGEKKPVLERAGDEEARKQGADPTAKHLAHSRNTEKRGWAPCAVPAASLGHLGVPCLWVLPHSGLENETSINCSPDVKSKSRLEVPSAELGMEDTSKAN